MKTELEDLEENYELKKNSSSVSSNNSSLDDLFGKEIVENGDLPIITKEIEDL